MSSRLLTIQALEVRNSTEAGAETLYARRVALPVARIGATVVLLAIFGAGMYLAPSLSAGLSLLVLGALFAGRQVWRRPELAVVLVAVVGADLVPRAIATVPAGGLRLDPADLGLIAALGVILVQGLRRGTFEIPHWSVGGPLLAFAAFATGSGLYARFFEKVNLGLVLGELRPALYCAGCALIVAEAWRSGRHVLLLVCLFLAADLTAGAVILGQFSSSLRAALPAPPIGLWQIQQVGGGGFGSVRMVPPGHVLMYLMANIAFCLLFGLSTTRRLRLALAVQVLFLVAALALTFTRAQWLASGIALLLAGVLSPAAMKNRLALALLITVSLIAFVAGLGANDLIPFGGGLGGSALTARAASISRPEETFGTASLQWRTYEDGAATRSIREHPLLGVGLGNNYRNRTLLQGEASGWLYPLDGNSSLTRFVHNGYLYLAVKMGLLAFAVFLCFCAALLLSGARVFFTARDAPAKLIVLASACSFAGLLEWGVFEPHFMLPASMAAVGVMAGLVMGVGAPPKSAGRGRTADPDAVMPPVLHLQSGAQRSAAAIASYRLPALPFFGRPRMGRASGDNSSGGGFRRGLLLTGSGTVINVLLLFIELLIIARVVSVGVYGGYVLLVALVNFLVMLTDFGLRLAVTHQLSSSNQEQQGSIVSSALLFRVAVLVAVTLVTLVVWAGARYFDPSWNLRQYLAYIPFMLIAASLDELLFAMLQGFQAYRPMAIALIGRGILRVVFTVFFLAHVHAGLSALVYSWCLSFALAIAYQYWVLPVRSVFGGSVGTLRAMLGFGRALQVIRFLAFVSTRLPVTFLGIFAGVDGVAYFAVANRIPDALQTLSDSYYRVYFPTVTAMLAQGRRKAAQDTFRRSLRLVSFAGALGAVVAVVFRTEIVTLVFSPKYARSATTFGLLMIALHVSVLVNVLGYTLTAARRPGRALWLDVGQTIVIAIADLVFIPIIGTAGAGLAAVLGNYLSAPPGAWLVRRSQFSVETAGYVRQVLLVWLCAALSWWLVPAGAFSGLAVKFAIVGLFLLLSPLLETIAAEDFALVVSKAGIGTEKPKLAVNVRWV